MAGIEMVSDKSKFKVYVQQYKVSLKYTVKWGL